MTAALKMVPSPVADHSDAAEDFLSNIAKIGEAWTAEIGGFGGLHIVGKSGHYLARWGSAGGPAGEGVCMADACIDLARKLAADIKAWAAEDDGPTLSATLEASIALVKLDRAVNL